MKIAIIGCGHMGGWFASQLSNHHQIGIFDIDREKYSAFQNVKVFTNIKEIKDFNPELLINAVNIQLTIEVFRQISPYIPKDCIICDIASIKTGLSDFYKQSGHHYASVHPMFGPRFAKLDKINGENAIIISESELKAKDFFKQFFALFQIHVFEYSFEEHDQLMGYSLTLPFASSIVFSACITQKTVPGTTFSKHKEIAEGLLEEDDYLLTEVLFNPYSLKQLEKITSRLEFLKHVIKAREYDEAKKFLKSLRDNLK
jgi:prephenate dehydrogenase